MTATNDSGICLTFYVAGDGPYSRRARDNLSLLLEALPPGVEARVVDVVENPEEALTKAIFTTPALVVEAGDARWRFIGDLSERDKVLNALQSLQAAS